MRIIYQNTRMYQKLTKHDSACSFWLSGKVIWRCHLQINSWGRDKMTGFFINTSQRLEYLVPRSMAVLDSYLESHCIQVCSKRTLVHDMILDQPCFFYTTLYYKKFSVLFLFLIFLLEYHPKILKLEYTSMLNK